MLIKNIVFMRIKFTLAASLFAASFAYGQNPTTIVSGKVDMFAQHVRFDASKAPEFKGKPTAFDEATKTMVEVSGNKLKVEKDALGFENHRFQQTIDGIPVEYGIMNVLVKNNKVISQNGEWFKKTSTSSTNEKKAAISEANALSSALSYVGASTYKWQDADEEAFLKNETNDKTATYYPKGTLVYYSDPDNPNSKNIKLAYKFVVYAAEHSMLLCKF